MGTRTDERTLNRALLARQGLLVPLELDVVSAAEAIGAVQSQYWPAVAVAFATRLAAFDPADLSVALERRALVTGSLVRATLHVTSARDHASYATVADASGACEWRRTTKDPMPEAAGLRALIAEYASTVRTHDEIAAFIEDWLAAHAGAIPQVEADRQRQSRWRPLITWPGLTRVGRWDTPRGPEKLLSAPIVPGSPEAPAPEDALDEAVRSYLRAFGPAGTDDITQWLGWRVGPIRECLARVGDSLAVFEDESGRTLYDLPDAPRPDRDAPTPVRLLPWFDSILLAYVPSRRQRILPEGAWNRAYRNVGLRIEPTFLVDGFVSGLWTIKATSRKAALTLTPFERLTRAVRAEVAHEAERLLGVLYPAAAPAIAFAE